MDPFCNQAIYLIWSYKKYVFVYDLLWKTVAFSQGRSFYDGDY